jgi:arsenate reductase (thioredoxin)
LDRISPLMPEMAMGSARTILFLCPHNAAKSVVAAAYFDQLARDRGLDYRAASAGTSPDVEPSPAVVAMLRDEGIDVAGHRPRQLSTEDLISAHRVISLGCDLDDLAGGNARVEHWDDVPPASQDLGASRAAIKRHLDALVDELAAGDGPLTPGV